MALFCATLFCLLPGMAGAWMPQQAPIETVWAAQVDPQNVWPEYPRPQLVREAWLNLNGVWQYQPGTEGDAVPLNQTLRSEILVPFPVESALSGVMEHHDRLWYRRTFTVPPAWAGQQIRLHFGAIDFESEVFINGKSMGIHRGGYDAFGYDITGALTEAKEQEIIVRVFDPTDEGGQPRGKQTLTPKGIMYTPTTGIWQPVWMEPVPATAIDGLRMAPDVDNGLVRVTVDSASATAGATVSVKVLDAGTVAASTDGKANEPINLAIPNAKLWSPENPFLYDLDITLRSGSGQADHVTSYFGMRSIKVADAGGVKRILLNGKPVFQFGPLDQGFWPDGIYTAPCEAAMKNDIAQMKALGFNMVRKHIKVEPDRWYYWTDKLGLLVWQDMPSANSYIDRGKTNVPAVDRQEFETELERMIKGHWNVPSIVTWVVFNEGQGQPDEQATRGLVKLVQTWDPSRLVNEASGGKIFGSGDLNDVHSYPHPNVRPITTPQAYVCGEYGGIGLKVAGHTWNEQGGGYANVSSGEDLLYLYSDFAQEVKQMRDEKGLCAAVYTQLTDVMTELNGLMTYDRVLKADPALLAKATHFELAKPNYETVVPTSEGEPQVWAYTTNRPPGNWSKAEFDDAAWAKGKAGFGRFHNRENTPWVTSDIWLRRHFNPGALSPKQLANLMVKDLHDDDVEVFINGVRAYAQRGFIGAYEYRSLTVESRAAVKPAADNVLAVHCLQKEGGQFIDAGLSVRVAAE